MADKRTEEIVKEISIRHIEQLRKEIMEYKENVDKRNIVMVDSLSYDIGSHIDYLKFGLKLTDQNRRQVEILQKEYEKYSDNVSECKCHKET